MFQNHLQQLDGPQMAAGVAVRLHMSLFPPSAGQGVLSSTCAVPGLNPTDRFWGSDPVSFTQQNPSPSWTPFPFLQEAPRWTAATATLTDLEGITAKVRALPACGGHSIAVLESSH